jgi:cysteine desulfuration protein SufE
MVQKSIQQVQDEIIEDFSLVQDQETATEYLIDLGKKMTPFPAEFMNETYEVKGCQAKVWLKSGLDENENVIFQGDSNSSLVKGLVYLLLKVYSGQTPHAILNSDLYFIDKIGLRKFITSQRSNGLTSMIKQIKLDALAFQTQIES